MLPSFSDLFLDFIGVYRNRKAGDRCVPFKSWLEEISSDSVSRNECVYNTAEGSKPTKGCEEEA